LRILCNACGHGFDVAPGALEVRCPECGARITLTAMETRPGARDRSTPDPAALVGTMLGGYELRSILGGGGMGTVYEAVRTGTAEFDGPEIAAVKVLSPAFTHEAQFVERFRREADALTRLRHPNLIEVYARGEHDEHYYFVMERFFGEDLRSLMARGPVAPETAAAIVKQAAAGLAYAHGNGIVHRDVKPANILVQGDAAREGRVKVVDFGVAQLASSNYTLTSLTSSSLVLGTINYMSPEQRIDASEIDHRADVYALGVVAYELLTGRLPIGAFELPSELVRVGRAADRAVLAALRRDPAHRPADVIAFAAKLESALARRRLPIAWAAAAAVVVAMFGGATWVANRMDAVEEQKVAPPPIVQQVEAPAYVPPAAIAQLAERMRQDADYALARSKETPPPKPRPKEADIPTPKIEKKKVRAYPPEATKLRVEKQPPITFEQANALNPAPTDEPQQKTIRSNAKPQLDSKLD
jgi:serine/threonine protein kinase